MLPFIEVCRERLPGLSKCLIGWRGVHLFWGQLSLLVFGRSTHEFRWFAKKKGVEYINLRIFIFCHFCVCFRIVISNTVVVVTLLLNEINNIRYVHFHRNHVSSMTHESLILSTSLYSGRITYTETTLHQKHAKSRSRNTLPWNCHLEIGLIGTVRPCTCIISALNWRLVSCL